MFSAVIALEVVLCVVNVQHHCANNTCQIMNIQNTCQDQEKISQLGAKVEHQNVKYVVLNTAQMHNRSLIQPFCIKPQHIDQENAIVTGTACEIVIQQAKAHKKNAAQASNSLLSVSPQPTTSTSQQWKKRFWKRCERNKSNKRIKGCKWFITVTASRIQPEWKSTTGKLKLTYWLNKNIEIIMLFIPMLSFVFKKKSDATNNLNTVIYRNIKKSKTLFNFCNLVIYRCNITV